MTLIIDWVAIDAADPGRLAEFWKQALDYERVEDDEEDEDEVLLVPNDGSRRRLLLLKVPDDKAGKNRLHLDLRPAGDQEAEVVRLEGLGARRVDIGQGEVRWVVMGDPEGNEFCVLRPLSAEQTSGLRYGD